MRGNDATTQSAWACGLLPGREEHTLLPVFTDATDASGRVHVLVRNGDGTVQSWGLNTAGQLGDGTTTSGGPVLAQGLSGVQALAAGTDHSLAVAGLGGVWAWGAHANGANGDPYGQARFVPTELASITGVRAVGAGQMFSLAQKYDGSVWAWGDNTWGQLGDGSSCTCTLYTPQPVTGLVLADTTWLTTDADGDGLDTWVETLLGSDPLLADSNDDGIPDGAELAAGRDPLQWDVDGDGVFNAQEEELGTDPFRADSDEDGSTDAQDCFPLDATRSQCPQPTPGDTTPPVITLIEPTNAQLISSTP